MSGRQRKETGNPEMNISIWIRVCNHGWSTIANIRRMIGLPIFDYISLHQVTCFPHEGKRKKPYRRGSTKNVNTITIQ